MTCELWITLNDLAACNCPETSDKTIIDNAMIAASKILYRLSGRRWPGICEATVVPCGCAYDGTIAGYTLDQYPSYPYRDGGQWLNTSCGCFRRGGCGGYQQVTLGTRMLVSVEAVRIGGETLDDSAYTVHEGRYLVRTDGGVWPCCSRNWEADIRYGRRPPADGKRAAAEYATELVKACTGDACKLPQRVQNIVRDGATMTILDPFDFLEDGRLGLPFPDQWLASVNPNRLQRRARVWAPGMGGKVRRIG